MSAGQVSVDLPHCCVSRPGLFRPPSLLCQQARSLSIYLFTYLSVRTLKLFCNSFGTTKPRFQQNELSFRDTDSTPPPTPPPLSLSLSRASYFKAIGTPPPPPPPPPTFHSPYLFHNVDSQTIYHLAANDCQNGTTPCHGSPSRHDVAWSHMHQSHSSRTTPRFLFLHQYGRRKSVATSRAPVAMFK